MSNRWILLFLFTHFPLKSFNFSKRGIFCRHWVLLSRRFWRRLCLLQCHYCLDPFLLHQKFFQNFALEWMLKCLEYEPLHCLGDVPRPAVGLRTWFRQHQFWGCRCRQLDRGGGQHVREVDFFQRGVLEVRRSKSFFRYPRHPLIAVGLGSMPCRGLDPRLPLSLSWRTIVGQGENTSVDACVYFAFG